MDTARRSEWTALAADQHVGVGQRMFATDMGEHSLLDVRCIELGQSRSNP
jgi:type VI secretion system protein ImpE